MNIALITLLLSFWSIIGMSSEIVSSLPLTSAQMLEIGHKIWKNECNGSRNGLTTWRKGEDFASMGIGHFIWFPAHTQHPYQETFPSLMKFMEQHGAQVPQFIIDAHYACPWKSRTEFYNAFFHPDMMALREFLFNTIELQVQFIMQRVERSLDGMVASCTSPSEKQHIAQQYRLLTQTTQGWYAIIDYINFKGEGNKETETYQGRGWGLKQVLLGMRSKTAKDSLSRMVASAKRALSDRVQHAPQEKKEQEQQWLKGWYNRLDTYLQA